MDLGSEVKYTRGKERKLNNTFIISIVLMFFTLAALAIAIVALYLSIQEEKKINLFTKGVSESKLLTATSPKILFTYYTQSQDLTLQKYSGYYSVTVNNSSAINFTVTDESGRDITGKIERGGNNLPTKVYYSSKNDISEINLNYTTSNDSIVLQRIDIILD